MMAARKGMMVGRGKGYYNYKPMFAHDRKVHHDAGLGRKQPQRMPQMMGGGKRIVTTEHEVFNYDELPEDAKQKALEKYYDINVDDNYWYDYDEKLGLNAKEMKKYGTKKIFDEGKTLYFDLDRGMYIQFPDLKVVDEEGFRKLLGIPKPLWKKVKDDYSFENNRDRNTALNLGKYQDYTEKEQKILRDAEERFGDKIQEAWKTLRDNYEYNTSKEAIEETFKINEYEFTKDGKIF
jgi:hypothetical protein